MKMTSFKKISYLNYVPGKTIHNQVKYIIMTTVTNKLRNLDTQFEVKRLLNRKCMVNVCSAICPLWWFL